MRLESELNNVRSKAEADKMKFSTDHNEDVKKLAIEVEDLKQSLEERSLQLDEVIERYVIAQL